jgi:cell division protein FtsB
MRSRFFSHRPILTVTQIIIFGLILVGLFFALDLNRRAQAGRLVGTGEETLVEELQVEVTRQAELRVTLAYVQSEDYVAAYARDEGGYILPGEKRIVPLIVEGTPEPSPPAAPTPDPAIYARPWQAWWRLLTDSPLPSR